MIVLGAVTAIAVLLQAPAPPVEPAFSVEDDLDCAIYVGALMAEMGAEMTPENRIGLTSAMTYFAGRYEAQRGLDLADAFVRRYAAFQARDPVEIEQTCSVRMRAFSVRLQQVGGAMERASPTAAPENTEQPDAPGE